MKKNKRNKRVVWASSLLRKHNTHCNVQCNLTIKIRVEGDFFCMVGADGACHLDLMHLLVLYLVV